jgi:hypothetical protein
MDEDQAGQERRAVEPHAAVGEDRLAARDEVGTEPRQAVQLREVGEILVEDREVDVENLVGGRRDAVVEVPLEVEDDRDPVLGERPPVLDARREIEAAVVVEAAEIHGFAGA